MMAEHEAKVQESAKAKVPPAVADYMSKIGTKGGKASGAKRMQMPVEQRRAIALLAAQARWKKRQKG